MTTTVSPTDNRSTLAREIAALPAAVRKALAAHVREGGHDQTATAVRALLRGLSKADKGGRRVDELVPVLQRLVARRMKIAGPRALKHANPKVLSLRARLHERNQAAKAQAELRVRELTGCPRSFTSAYVEDNFRVSIEFYEWGGHRDWRRRLYGVRAFVATNYRRIIRAGLDVVAEDDKLRDRVMVMALHGEAERHGDMGLCGATWCVRHRGHDADVRRGWIAWSYAPGKAPTPTKPGVVEVLVAAPALAAAAQGWSRRYRRRFGAFSVFEREVAARNAALAAQQPPVPPPAPEPAEVISDEDAAAMAEIGEL